MKIDKKWLREKGASKKLITWFGDRSVDAIALMEELKSSNLNYMSWLAISLDDAKTLNDLRNDKYRYVRIGVASNANASSETLHKMRKDADVDVREMVARNINTATETLHNMRNDSNELVRWMVVRHPNTSAETLHAMRNDADAYIRRTIARNPNTSAKTLNKMRNDKNADVRYVAKENLDRRKNVTSPNAQTKLYLFSKLGGEE